MKFNAIKGPANNGFYLQLIESLDIDVPSAIIAELNIIGQISKVSIPLTFVLSNLVELMGSTGITFIEFPTTPVDDYYTVSLSIRLDTGSEPFLEETNNGFGMINTLQEAYMAKINAIDPSTIHYEDPKLVIPGMFIKALEFLAYDNSAAANSTFVKQLPFLQKSISNDQ